MEVGGQRIGNFASGGVLDVVNSSEVVDDVVSQLDVSDLEEGMMDLDDLPMIKSYNTPEENAVGKILGRALMKKDWAKYSPQELFAELESENPELADDIAKVAKIVYNVKLEEGKSPHKKGTKKYKKHMAAMHAGESVTNEAKFSPLQQAYDKIYQLTDKMGDEALEQMNRYAPKFSNALEKHEDIETIEKREPQNVDFYIRELEDAEFQIGESIKEAEYNGKKVKLNKPMRSSGGGKKYKVYVKNPKTGRVKKISFGDAGLKTKSSNKKRAKSFAARHNCEKKNDKMKAGYWACRLPRYGLVKGGKWW